MTLPSSGLGLEASECVSNHVTLTLLAVRIGSYVRYSHANRTQRIYLSSPVNIVGRECAMASHGAREGRGVLIGVHLTDM